MLKTIVLASSELTLVQNLFSKHIAIGIVVLAE